MKRRTARTIAVRLSFALSENHGDPPLDPIELINQTFDEEYYLTLQEEDELYAEAPDEKQLDYITRVVTGVQERTAELDEYIQKYSVGWKIGRIPGTAMAIMRVAIFEVLYVSDVPEGSAINEAVELAKQYETDETRAFINGILGSFSRSEGYGEGCDEGCDDVDGEGTAVEIGELEDKAQAEMPTVDTEEAKPVKG